ncbi:MAG: helix-turn-helix transcriptional regulator [Kiritimatiellae bacterium]|jgi:y4mF family transcriptional regulator|nr:helix-turn-helix transcriptional regulator [Kiritimatiellia bacterium]
MYTENLIKFIKSRRKELKMTQVELAERAGVGLRFIRDLEQGKQTIRVDKVNQVLMLFGHVVGPVPIDRSKYYE